MVAWSWTKSAKLRFVLASGENQKGVAHYAKNFR